jgi:hypothetical protein
MAPIGRSELIIEPNVHPAARLLSLRANPTCVEANGPLPGECDAGVEVGPAVGGEPDACMSRSLCVDRSRGRVPLIVRFHDIGSWKLQRAGPDAQTYDDPQHRCTKRVDGYRGDDHGGAQPD